MGRKRGHNSVVRSKGPGEVRQQFCGARRKGHEADPCRSTWFGAAGRGHPKATTRQASQQGQESSLDMKSLLTATARQQVLRSANSLASRPPSACPHPQLHQLIAYSLYTDKPISAKSRTCTRLSRDTTSTCRGAKRRATAPFALASLCPSSTAPLHACLSSRCFLRSPFRSLCFPAAL
jgi:hypothetical protein